MCHMCGTVADMTDPEPPRIKRINVAVNAAEVAALDLLIEREGVSLTEAVRRLVSYGDFVYRAVKVDSGELVLHPKDGKPRAVELL